MITINITKQKQQLYEEFIEGAKEVNAPSSTVATVQREQEGKKEREKQREKQEKEDALRRGLQRPRSPANKREKIGDKPKASDDGRQQGLWQQKLDQQMERHKRRISLGPRLSVFQLRDQYMTVPTGLSLFDNKPADTFEDDSTSHHVGGPTSSTHAHVPLHSNYSVYPLKLIDCPSHPLNPPVVPPPEQSQHRAAVAVRKEPVSLTYVMAPSAMPTPKLAPSGRSFKQLKAL